jgi:hypothetical protein
MLQLKLRYKLSSKTLQFMLISNILSCKNVIALHKEFYISSELILKFVIITIRIFEHNFPIAKQLLKE